MERLNELIDFLEYLDDNEVVYELDKIREDILIEVFVENKMWEIEYVVYPDEIQLEVEVFESDSQTFGISEIEALIRDFGNEINCLPKYLQKAQKYSREEFFDFLEMLDKEKIYYKLRRKKDDLSIIVEVVVPGERWQIKHFKDGSIRIKKFISDGNIVEEKEISNLYKKFGANI